MTDKIKVTGLKELEAQLRKLETEVGAKAVRGALMTASKPMADQMKADVPVDKGNLKKTIGRRSGFYKGDKTTRKFQETFAGNNAIAAVQVGAIKKGAWKAHFVEFGTEKSAAQPFIRPAAYALWQQTVSRFKDSLARRIKRLQKKA
ncbi:HK97-gp10 family putative phage morphogenesis protein [Endozoicomonas sp. 2B-B]